MIEEKEVDSSIDNKKDNQSIKQTDSCNCEKEDSNKGACDCEDNNCNCSAQANESHGNDGTHHQPHTKQTFSKNHYNPYHKHKHDKNHARIDNTDYKSEATITRLTQSLQQLQADFDNYRKRNQTLAQDSKNAGIFDAVKALLPAFDAVLVAKKQITDENTVKGLEMVERELLSSLATLSITKIKTVGEQFDPNLHNVVMAEEITNVPSGEIVEEYSAGFTSPSGVVRFANVKIAK